MTIRKLAGVGAVLLALLAIGAGPAGAQKPPAIHTQWSTTGSSGGALNVSVSNLPPNAPVVVTVTDISNGHQVEQPSGTPPKQADDKGNWPGAKAGTQTGYPDTAKDPAGTRYVVCVKVNGKTGPCMEVRKPGSTRNVWSIVGTLGLILLTDGLGITSQVGAPLASPRTAWAGVV